MGIAMIKALDNLGYKGITHEGFSSSMKEIRNELQIADETITYSELRKRTILQQIQKCDPSNNTKKNPNSTTSMEVEVAVEQSFKAWLDERTASAERNLFPDAIQMLETIKHNYPDVVIGAITNGRGNPLHMKKLPNYFQFCISGEDDSVFPHRKPHRGIYDATLSHVNNLYSISLQEEFSSSPSCWVHVGDDLVNDVAASAACGAIPIWLDWEDDDIIVRGTTQGKSWSSATVEEQTKRQLLAEEAKKNSMSASIKSLMD